MTQIKHTPGPWAHIDGFTVRHPQVYSDTGPVCNATWLGDVRIDELRANARLISAAPELLEALQQGDQIDDLHRKMHRIEKRRNRGSFGIAVADDEDAIEWQKLSSEVEILISKRNAVIAKATGT